MTNPYPAQFLALLATADGPVLDSGAGDRRHPGVTCFDRCPGAEVQGDVMAMPYPDDHFALVLSQAVVEHVPEPQAYVDEVVRVLRPGGLLYVEAAFMQPIHMAPDHYFNITPYGLAYLCRELDIIEQTVFGRFDESWDWIGREINAPAILGATRFAAVRTAMTYLDRHVSLSGLRAAAPAVSLLGRKR